MGYCCTSCEGLIISVGSISFYTHQAASLFSHHYPGDRHAASPRSYGYCLLAGKSVSSVDENKSFHVLQVFFLRFRRLESWRFNEKMEVRRKTDIRRMHPFFVLIKHVRWIVQYFKIVCQLAIPMAAPRVPGVTTYDSSSCVSLNPCPQIRN